MTNYSAEWKDRKWDDMIKYSPAPRHRRNIICQNIKEFIKEKKTLHDVGCGNGWLLNQIQRQFPQLNLSGSDAAQSIIDYNRKTLQHIHFYHQDISMPLTISDRYDIVICAEVLEHVEDFQIAISNLYTLLKKNGVAIITVPCGRIYPIDKIVGHVRHFNNGNSIAKDGFQVIKEQRWGFPFFNLYKWCINLFPDKMNFAFCESKYGLGKKIVSNLVHILFFLNIPYWGNQLIVVLRKKSSTIL